MSSQDLTPVSPDGTATAANRPGGADLPATTADPSLTLEPRRLKGSPQCLNCGTALLFQHRVFFYGGSYGRRRDRDHDKRRRR